MSIIDSTYFEKGILYIPNNKDVSAAPVGAPSIKSELEFCIEKNEPNLLMNSLGVTNYRLLETAMLDLPNADQKWKDLVDGADYTINSKWYRWDGLRGFNKESLIACYVFCKYLRNDESIYTTVGVIKNTAKNAVNFNPTKKYLVADASFIKQYQSLDESSVKRSLYQYLTDMNELDSTSFPDFEFKFYTPANFLGI